MRRVFDTRAKSDVLFQMLVDHLSEDAYAAKEINKYVQARTGHLTIINLNNSQVAEADKKSVFEKCLLSLGWIPFNGSVEKARETKVNNRIRKILKELIAEDESIRNLISQAVAAEIAAQFSGLRTQLRKEMLTACVNTRKDLLKALQEGLTKALEN